VYHHFSYSSPEYGWAEQDAESVWKLVDRTVRQGLSQCRPEPEIEAIAVSVQGDAIIPINSQGAALHPAILGMDTRSAREAAELEERFGRGQLYAATGMPCEPLNAITKIAWLARGLRTCCAAAAYRPSSFRRPTVSTAVPARLPPRTPWC
jgi:xylulokinase